MVGLFWDGTLLGNIAELHDMLDNRTVPVKPWRPAHIYCLLSIVDPLGSDAGRGIGEFNDIKLGAAPVVASRRVDLASVLTTIFYSHILKLQLPILRKSNQKSCPRAKSKIENLLHNFRRE